MSVREETFAVYIAGEQIDGTNLGMTYMYVTTPLGQIRMTAEEADELGRKLIAAAEYDRESEEESTPPFGRRYRLTREHLQSVVAVYREALGQGHGPTRAVADHFGIPHTTAAKWVGRARKHGLLPATRKGYAS